ncbi:MAG: N-acetylglucosamine-6-phosphate deacetylase [Clostridiales bacterium]|nr:N-acetylglucosamine-6-phosphate deacetylase [Clostridiales bacterium]
MIIKNANVFSENGSFVKKDIYIDEDRITQDVTSSTETLDGEGLYAIPGLIDLHFHGCVGYDFCDGTHEDIQAIANYQASNGITSIAPATMTLNEEELSKIFSAAGTYKSDSGAALVGIHMEGPYLSVAKKGAQDGKYIIQPNVEHFHKMNKLSGGLIKLVSLAPEEEGSIEFIDAVKEEVIISLAHTTADYDTATKALEHGASHVTHLYNAMPPFNHREPSVVGAAFDKKNCYVELICDGVHIHPSVIRASFQLFGDDRVVLVSDSMMATGMEDGNYSLGGQAVSVTGNRATLIDGTIAGSATNLMKCMQTAISYGIPLESTIKAASVNPAKQLGIYKEYGSITPGKYANIVLLDKDFSLKQVILRGKLIK